MPVPSPRPRLVVAIAVAAALAACADSVSPRGAPTELAVGTWGGAGAGTIVTDTLVHVHIGCTFGDIRGPVALDANGRFTRDGSYVLRAYPVFVGPALPAQFSGVVEGDRLTIAAAVNDTTTGRVVVLGPVSVTLGTTPQLGPCPICTVPGMRQMARPAAPAMSFASAADRAISLRSAFSLERGAMMFIWRHASVIPFADEPRWEGVP